MKENWQYKKLGEVVTFIGDGDWIESRHQSEKGFRLIQTGNIGNGIFRAKDDSAHYISEDTFNDLNCTEIFEGDCLISRLPDPIGRACIIPSIGNKMITAVDCTILRFNKILLPKYFINYTLSQKYALEIKKKTTGSTRKRISRKNLETIQLPVPPLPEQERIVAELDLLSGIIEKQKQQLKELDTLAQSIFCSMFGDPIDNEKGWNTIEFENCIEKIKYPNKLNTKDYFNDGNYPIISQEDILISGYTNRKDCVFKVNTPVVIFGDHTRCFKFITFDFALGADGVKILSPIKKINPRFLYYCLILFKIPSLGYSRHYKLLKELNVPTPPIDLQNQFAEKIEKIEMQKEAINKSIEETQKLFDFTMDKYFG